MPEELDHEVALEGTIRYNHIPSRSLGSTAAAGPSFVVAARYRQSTRGPPRAQRVKGGVEVTCPAYLLPSGVRVGDRGAGVLQRNVSNSAEKISQGAAQAG